MKVYLFDEISGVYQGEDFLEPSEIPVVAGVTSQAPPEKRSGYTPIYDQASAAWRQVPTDALKKTVAHHD